MKKFLISMFAVFVIAANAVNAGAPVSRGNYDYLEYAPQRTTPAPQRTYPVQQTYPQQQQPVQNSDPIEVQSPIQVQDSSANYTGQPKTVADLAPGTIVSDPKSVWNWISAKNYAGETEFKLPVFWFVIGNDINAADSTLLLAKYNVANYPFNHPNKGMTTWVNSDIRRWLRTTFWKHLTSEFQNAVVNVDVENQNLNGALEKSNENVYLLSIVELSLSDRKNNGRGLDYQYLQRDLKGESLKLYGGKGGPLTSGGTERYLTRTINRPKAESAGYREDVFRVNLNGILETERFDRTYYVNVRPALNIKSTTKVSGPHTFKLYHPNNRGDFQYYTLEF